MATRVLVTGARGAVGGVVMRALAPHYDVVGVDVKRRTLRRGAHADMTRPRHARRVLQGVDVVVDLASTHWQQPWSAVLGNNVPAAWNAMEAAWRAGARRLVYASSNHVTGLYEREEPYASILAGRLDGLDPHAVPRLTAASRLRPDTPYAVGKACAEAAASYHADVHGLSVLCLRIGTLNRVDRPMTQRHLATWISHADLAQLVRCCIEAPPELRFGIFYGVSANTWRIWDIDAARSALGYAPGDDAERWRAEVERERQEPPPSRRRR